MDSGATIVIDLGKTLSKVSLWDAGGHMLDRQVRANIPLEVGGIRRLDAPAIGAWLLDTLGRFADVPVSRIVPVGHGAGVCALIDGALAFPPLDYEQPVPEAVLAGYRAQRDPFAQTGSPALPDGLNFGSQLYWLDQLHPDTMARATLLPWAQYWAWFLTGTAVSEVTSLGCHSDLWCPQDADFSPMAERRGWASRFAPIKRAGDVVGTLRPEIAAATGLSPDVQVLAGLHDSNAALLAARGFAEIADNEATVLSTGTWFIGMRLPATPVDTTALPEARDCLVNVDVHGRAVPSARFMGGREIETLIEIDTRRVDIKPDQPALLAAVPEVLGRGRMILPTLMRGFGPFAQGRFGWINRPEDWFERRAAACLYAALVADTALDLIGASDRLLVEGRFAEAEVFVRALASLRPDTAVYTANAHNDVSFGALRLIDPTLTPQGQLVRVQPLDADLSSYRNRWQAEVAASAERTAA
ncbi:MAG: FGGY family carbohydrate kinase [Novosphingobium sp.]|uniref:FGGY-family carbohydrate kinase n=1 Tax=Novosphingobium sp. TaxID=1874826 RepID=UPI002734CFC8|nr:FGGY family carbohydrate kinase [Novosphingobium sp.]MDP3549340.1 FGGY family carbohydrate kinase [Novosphingobium sp.]